METGQHVDHRIQALLGDVHLQPHNPIGAQGSLEQHGDVFDLLPFPWIRHGRFIGNQLGIGLHHLVDHAQTMGANGDYRSLLPRNERRSNRNPGLVSVGTPEKVILTFNPRCRKTFGSH